MTTTERTDEGKIRALLGEFTDAIRTKDAAAASALYADDIVVYDLAPPLCIEGPELHDTARMQEWFDTWASPIESKSHRLTIRVGGDVGYAFALQHMTDTVMECNCSHCSRKGYLLWFVPRTEFTLKSPEASLSTYTFNKHVIKHHFCPKCGCAPFGFGVSNGVETAAINVRCLEGVELSTLERKFVDGRSL